MRVEDVIASRCDIGAAKKSRPSWANTGRRLGGLGGSQCHPGLVTTAQTQIGRSNKLAAKEALESLVRAHGRPAGESFITMFSCSAVF